MNNVRNELIDIDLYFEVSIELLPSLFIDKLLDLYGAVYEKQISEGELL